MSTYTVKYYAGPYSGTRTVTAEDPQEAIDQVRGWVRREMTLPMYADGYKIVNQVENNQDDE